MERGSTSIPVTPWHSSIEFSSPLLESPRVSLVLSLYNYGHVVLETLASVYAQTLNAIELLVIDDASTDDGPQIVEDWLRQHGQRFAGARLIRHKFNAGLAAARNTGFSLSLAPWVWVLDADNILASLALEQCLHLAERADSRVAVVHPLLLTVPEGASPQVFQGEGRPWQRDIFKPANAVDAMALVRHSAWVDVGGYVDNIGWTDYDFWCMLIEAGWSGVQCPQVLGCYTHHSESMTARSSLPNVRLLEQILKQRHPWLNCIGKTIHHPQD